MPTLDMQFIKSNPQAEVYKAYCAFVPLVEEGFCEHPALELIAREYLQDMDWIKATDDSLVLGCTHYPLISKTIAKIMGDKVTIIDPAITACEELIAKLTQNNSLTHIRRRCI